MKNLKIRLAILWGHVLLAVGPSTARSLKGVYYRLMAQGPSTRYGSTTCLYRGPNGTKCAAGWLIPDNRFPGTEGTNVRAMHEYLHLPRGVTIEHVEKAQYAHDQAVREVKLYNKGNWPEVFDHEWRYRGLPT